MEDPPPQKKYATGSRRTEGKTNDFRFDEMPQNYEWIVFFFFNDTINDD